MAYVQPRPSGGYTGYFKDSTGKRRSAGTYMTFEEAMVRAKDREGEPPTATRRKRGDTGLYRDWVGAWIDSDEDDIEPRTKEGYACNLRAHVVPVIGDYRTVDITQETIQHLLRELKKKGLSPQVRAQCKAAVGRTFHSLVPYPVPVNPTHGVTIELPPPQKYRLVTSEDFRALHEALPNEGARLFAAFLVGTGVRFGEGTEVRVRDLDLDTREVYISRRVVAVSGRTTSGSRFQVLGGTKSGSQRGRSIVLPPSLIDRIQQWIASNRLGPQDLLFPKRLIGPGDLDDAIPVEPGAKFSKSGKNYRHGTAAGYSGGGCRCEHCRVALRQYRRELKRRRLTTPNRVPVGRNLTGHLSNDHWRKIWRKAVKDARLGWYPRTHDLRHAFATNLVAAGISIYEVMEIMGHRNVETTMRYQHRVDRMRSKAVDAAAEFLGESPKEV